MDSGKSRSSASLDPKPLKNPSVHDEITSSELINASLEYMRTPSPESCEGSSSDRPWMLGSLFGLVSSTSPASSPVLSCPPSWLEGPQETSELENEDEDENFHLEVPLASSSPDLASSSTRSSSSEDSEGPFSSWISTSVDSVSHPVYISEHSPSQEVVDFSTGSTADDFGQRLHQLLLIALTERERDQDSLDLDQGEAGYISCTDSSECHSPDYSSGRHRLYSQSPPNGQALVSKWFLSQAPTEEREDTKDSSLNSRYSQPPNAPEEISPVCFSSASRTSSCRNAKKDTAEVVAPYRMIAQSYITRENLEQEGEPQTKRQKTGRDLGPRAGDRIYARRTASLRRADSLKSVLVDNAQKPAAVECIPTVPATPVAPTPRRIRDNSNKKSEYANVLMSPVPIIAPPKDHAPKLPLSTETLAKVRLSRYLEREARGREMDGLPTGICKRPPAWMVRETIEDGWSYVDDEDTWEDDTMIEWEVILGIGRKRREAVVSWLLDVLPSRKPGHAPSTVSSPTTSSLSSTSLSPSSFSLSTFSSSTVSSQDTSDTRPHTCSNLQDQLQNSPETRFHAVWMFLRYFYLTMSPGLDSESRPSRASISRTSSIDSDRSSVQEEGLGLVVWDIAVACLSVSVKFHRDFLDPLLPVYAQEYLALAPHDLSHEDLESAHRDVLSAFDYRLGVTPQPVMDELWSSLSSLRNLLDFEGGWKYAMLDAWTRLFVVLDEPDVQRFLVSMLTVVALMDGVIESLVDEYCRDEVLKTRSISPAAERYLNLQTLRKKFNIRAREESEGVFCDIQALTGVTDVDLRECRVWMSRQLK